MKPEITPSIIPQTTTSAKWNNISKTDRKEKGDNGDQLNTSNPIGVRSKITTSARYTAVSTAPCASSRVQYLETSKCHTHEQRWAFQSGDMIRDMTTETKNPRTHVGSSDMTE